MSNENLLKVIEASKKMNLFSKFTSVDNECLKEVTDMQSLLSSPSYKHGIQLLLSVFIQNKDLWSMLSNENKSFLIDQSDIHYRYNGPLDKNKTIVENDSYLHMAAREGNIDAFMYFFKRDIEHNIKNIKNFEKRVILLPNNANYENPFHLAASQGVLLHIIKEMFECLNSKVNSLEDEIKKAKENIKGYKEKLKFIKSEKEDIRDSLCGKSALNRRNKTPIGCVENTEMRKKIKEIAGIKDSLICNEKLCLCLYVLGSIAFTMILCLSLYFLYLASQTFALSSMASIAAGGTAFLANKACSEIYDLNVNDASIQTSFSPGATSISV